MQTSGGWKWCPPKWESASSCFFTTWDIFTAVLVLILRIRTLIFGIRTLVFGITVLFFRVTVALLRITGCLCASWHQPVDREERRRNQKRTGNWTENNTRKHFYWLVSNAIIFAVRVGCALHPCGGYSEPCSHSFGYAVRHPIKDPALRRYEVYLVPGIGLHLGMISQWLKK